MAVDRKARVLNAVGKASMKGIPVIEVNSVDNGLNSRAVKEALTILGGLPDTMRTVITKVSAKTQDSITTELSSGKYVVVWGDSSELKLKSAIVDKAAQRPVADRRQASDRRVGPEPTHHQIARFRRGQDAKRG